jgi:hypothetical protein
MLASINPLGERGRQQRYAITVTTFVMGSTAAGALLGGVLGWLGSAFTLDIGALVVVAIVAVLGVLFDLGAFGWRVPGPRRQVDERWLSTYRGWVYGLGFGVQLGLGFTTIVTASATWVAFACALFSGSPRGGLVIGATYGLVRALPVLMTARVREPGVLRALMRALDRWQPRVAAATLAVQLGAVLTTVAIAFALGAG